MYSTLKESLLSIWPTLAIITVTLISIRFTYHKNHREKFIFYKEFWNFITIIYAVLLYDLVTNVDLNIQSSMNLIPFTEILRYSVGSKMFYYQVLGNIALFIPFGLLISAYIKPKKGWSIFFIGLFVSLTIEAVQMGIGRSFDVDDIILNTFGCFIGYIIYFVLNKIRKFLPKFMHSDWFNNLICIIITACIVLYVLKIMGVYSII